MLRDNDDVIVRYEGDDAIGFTVLHTSTRIKKTARMSIGARSAPYIFCRHDYSNG